MDLSANIRGHLFANYWTGKASGTKFGNRRDGDKKLALTSDRTRSEGFLFSLCKCSPVLQSSWAIFGVRVKCTPSRHFQKELSVSCSELTTTCCHEYPHEPSPAMRYLLPPVYREKGLEAVARVPYGEVVRLAPSPLKIGLAEFKPPRILQVFHEKVLSKKCKIMQKCTKCIQSKIFQETENAKMRSHIFPYPAKRVRPRLLYLAVCPQRCPGLIFSCSLDAGCPLQPYAFSLHISNTPRKWHSQTAR